MKIVSLTPEVKAKAIGWINDQDIFRTKQFFKFMNTIPKNGGHLYKILQCLRVDEYIQGLEKDQYIVIKKAPIDLPIDPKHFKKMP